MTLDRRLLTADIGDLVRAAGHRMVSTGGPAWGGPVDLRLSDGTVLQAPTWEARQAVFLAWLEARGEPAPLWVDVQAAVLERTIRYIENAAQRAEEERRKRETEGRQTFGTAIDALKRGERVARSGWNGKGMWLELQEPDGNSKMTLPYIFMSTAQGDLVPWLASQTDILAEDWSIVRSS